MAFRTKLEGTAQARLMFHGTLASLLRKANTDGCVMYPVGRRASIKDMAESLGVPHTEIHDLRCNGRDADLSHLPGPGEVLELFPASGPVDVTRTTRLRPGFSRGLRFVVDENVAGLAPLLRGLGLDAAYNRAWSDAFLARLAREQERVVLSRDRALLKRSCIAHGRLIRSEHPDEQLREVLNFYSLPDGAVPFSRCLRCNQPLHSVDKKRVEPLLLPRTRLYYQHFKQCPQCGRIYWPGSHQQSMRARYAALGIGCPGESA
jgi:uncharacterized protein with PIN domain